MAIEDVTDREYHKRDLEELVKTRTAELTVAMEEAEKGKEIAEASLFEIRKLKIQLEAERAYLQEEIELEHNHENIIGKSDALDYVLYKIEQIAATDTTVLVLGETGTGKELVARAIHNLSKRKNAGHGEGELRHAAFKSYRKRTVRTRKRRLHRFPYKTSGAI